VIARDLLTGSVAKHLLRLSFPIMADLAVISLYYLVDLYFIAQLGPSETAGVSAASAVLFLFSACLQILNVATASMIARHAGRKDEPAIQRTIQQSLGFAVVLGFLSIACGYALTPAYVGSVTADATSATHGVAYLYWFFPGLWIQCLVTTMRAALRGLGAVSAAAKIQVASVGLNMALAPVLIAGVGTSHAFGVRGAAMASNIAIALSAVALWWFMKRHGMRLGGGWIPTGSFSRQSLALGLPACGEVILLFVFTSIGYWAIRDLGSETQAAFGVVIRILQVLYLPVLAISFALVPLAGQNLGAAQFARAVEAFRVAILVNVSLGILLALICVSYPAIFVDALAPEGAAASMASQILGTLAWTLVPFAIVLPCSTAFQALGNTVPSFVSSCIRLAAFAIPLLLLPVEQETSLRLMLDLTVWTLVLQAVVSLAWLRKSYLAFSAQDTHGRSLGSIADHRRPEG
jgi:putative MATE family efflux protein